MEREKRILVVDDESVVRNSFNRVLSESGYTVNTASDGAGALEKVKNEPFDIVFVDLKMPGINGMEVVRNIRKMYPSTQVIIVTGYGTPEAVKEAENLGVANFVPKPVTPEQLTNITNTAWERRTRVLEAMKQEIAELPVKEVTPVTRAIPYGIPLGMPQGVPAVEEGKRPPLLKVIPMLILGAITGLVYVMFLPFVGFVMLFGALGKKIYIYVSGKTRPNASPNDHSVGRG